MTKPVRWSAEKRLIELLDQTVLPVEERWLELRSVSELAEAIRSLRVRGAPAIGIAAAYGVALAAIRCAPGDDVRVRAKDACDVLGATRPTAVNLFAALERMRRVWEQDRSDTETETLGARLLNVARSIEREEEEAGRRIGTYGLPLLRDCRAVLTHCNAGGVATAGYGTALAPLFLLAERGVPIPVFVDETRPLLQGSRITAWELLRAGIPATLITDSMAAHVMERRLVDAVIVGADRVARNGDTANKIGTYGLAVLARHHGVPFYVAMPATTFDPATPSGAEIPIEQRASEEVARPLGVQAAPVGITVYNPAFDVTPADLITAFITDAGVLRPPYTHTLRSLGHPA